MVDSKELNFTLQRQEIVIHMVDDKGLKRDYKLRELDGTGRDKYLNAVNRRLKINDEGKVSGFKDFVGMQSDLLSMCLYDEQGMLVPPKTIQEWPSSVVTQLFETAQKLNGTTKDSEAEAKND